MPERFSPINTSCSGPDGSGKDTAVAGTLDLLFGTFGKNLQVVRLDRPPMYLWMDEANQLHTKKLFLPWFRLINRAHQVGDKQGNIRLVQAANALNVVTQGWVVRPAVDKIWHPNLYISGRNYFADPAVYADFYAPELTKMSFEQRMRFMKRISLLPDYDQMFLFSIEPEIAVKRILGRIADERIKPTGQIGWTHRHETIEGLSRLSDSFKKIPQAMNSEFPQTQIIPVDASVPKNEVANLIAGYIGVKLQGILGINQREVRGEKV